MATNYSSGLDPFAPIVGGGGSSFGPGIVKLGNNIKNMFAPKAPNYKPISKAAEQNSATGGRYNPVKGSTGTVKVQPGSAAGQAAGAAGLSLEDILNMFGGGSGGGGGGGSRGPNISALLAGVNDKEARAKERYAKNSADVTNMYGQLSQAISGYQPTLQADYAANIASTNDRAAQNQGALTSELGAQDARRQQAASALGITGGQLAGQPELESASVLNEAIGNIGNTATNWSGFLNADEANAVGRNQNTATAATATGAQTNDDMRDNLEAYIQNLDQERSQIRASGGSSGGGGGGGGSKQNPLAIYAGKALIDQLLGGGEEEKLSPYQQKLQALSGLGLNSGNIGQSLQNIDTGKANANDYWVKQALGLIG